MKVPISEAYFFEPIMRGADSCSSLNVYDTNIQRRAKYSKTKMEYDSSSGVLTIHFKGRKHFVGAGNVKWAGELQEEPVVAAPPPEVDEDDEVTSPFTDAEEIDDMPDDIPAKKSRVGSRKG